MNKLIVTAIAAVCLVGSVMAQDKVEPIPTPATASQNEFNEIWASWLQFNNWDKEAAYGVMDQMRSKIQEDFPMDPQIAQAIDKLSTDMYTALNAKAAELGFSNYKDAMQSSDPRTQELKAIEVEYSTQRSNLTSAYNAEFNQRFESACIEAVKRLMENANTMK